MLEIKNLYKKQKDNYINNVSFKVEKGNLVSIESNSELSDMLIKLILNEEVIGSGEIYIDDINNSEYMRKNNKSIGAIFRKEGFYERFTVEEYMKYYSEIIGSKINYKEIMKKLSLIELSNKRIKTLNYSQKRMLSLARERLKEPELLIFQDPIFNMDREGTRIILENIEELYSKGTAMLTISMSFKDTMLIGGKTYILDESGIKENEEKKDENVSKLNCNEEKGYLHKVQKIPAKLDEKILLFDPVEIDYIESESGISNLNVRGEKFSCTMSLTELENNLELFGFFRCHRSYVVNLQRVREVITWTRNSYSLTLDDKQKSSIPLSKGKLAELKRILKI